MNLIGIDNVGEFYPPHYFRSLVTDGIDRIVDQWKTEHRQEGRRLPWNALESLASDWTDVCTRAAELDSARERWEATRELHVEFLDALGYTYDPEAVAVGDTGSGRVVPTLVEETRDGQPWLWAIEAPMPRGEEVDRFDQPVRVEQLAAMPDLPHLERDTDAPAADELLPWNDALDEPASWQTILDDWILPMEQPPKWVLFFVGDAILLIDIYKWGRGEYLRFDFQEIFDRRESPVLQVVCALLHRDAINPDDDVPLLEELETEFHKHAHSVSTELKHNAREAIELLGNEIVWHRRHVGNQNVLSWEGDDDSPEALAEALTEDCLTFLYRLLFLLYAESRGGELGILPTDSEAYRAGCSLESLRDLETKRLETTRVRDGYYLHNSLRKLFELVNEGFNESSSQQMFEEDEASDVAGESIAETFAIRPLQSRLFDSDALHVLDDVRLRNRVLQEVIRLLSLSEEGDRISYTDLGINQLGAIYEGLLAYEGFFAEATLYEIRDPDDMNDEDPRAWFVPAAEIEMFEDDEIVTEPGGEPVTYERGRFLYRRAGRAREQSASYYTPEELTECLTAYTLKERLNEPPAPGWGDQWDPAGDREKLEADEILDLTVCEPAMGSGAFLNEAIDQLADAYLKRKQRELGETLSPNRYRSERRKVKYYLATHNCYGVDLDRRAAELGEISMWLNVLHEGATAPWFDAQIAVGNSIVGARRAVYPTEAIQLDGDADWRTDPPELVRDLTGDSTVGRQLPPRPDGTVYHFLLPSPGMCPFDDVDVLEELAPEHAERIAAWRRRFNEPLDDGEIQGLLQLSERIDVLWAEHLADRRDVWRETRPSLDLWGQPSPESSETQTIEECRAYADRELHYPRAAGRRLKAAMDDWAALWFWPTRESERLPSREQFWNGIAHRLERGRTSDVREGPDHLEVADEVAERRQFQHWEAQFPEVFAEDGGFDVVLGNPPWIDVSWQERGILSEIDPRVAIRDYTGQQAADRRGSILEQRPDAEDRYIAEAERVAGTARFLADSAMYPELEGQRTNTYKNFIVRSWDLQHADGETGLLHPNDVFDNPRGQRLRRKILRALDYRFHFRNEPRLLEEVDHNMEFSLNVYAESSGEVDFWQIACLFHPVTVADSFEHDGLGPVPGLKTDEGDWELRGHRDRIVPFDMETLRLAESALGEDDETSAGAAGVPPVFARELLDVFEAIQGKSPLGENGEAWETSREWHEGEEQEDGMLVPDTHWPEDPSEMIYSGPNLFVGNPLYKTPDAKCSSNLDYSPIDLAGVEPDYLPRTHYRIGCDEETYRDCSPTWKGDSFWNYYRHGHREYVDPTAERTLAGGILPPGSAHVDAIISMAFETRETLLTFEGLTASLPYDFLPRISGREHLNVDFVSSLPFDVPEALGPALRVRAARLNCLTTYYRELWESAFEEAWTEDGFAADAGDVPQLTPWDEEVDEAWSMDSALRTCYERRRARVELDALAALALGLTADQLCTIYRIQFPVLRQYENKTFYDQRGTVVCSRKANVGAVDLGDFRQFRDAQSREEMLQRAPDEHREQLEDFEPPFVRCDREREMREAHETFRRRFGLEREAESTKVAIELTEEVSSAKVDQISEAMAEDDDSSDTTASDRGRDEESHPAMPGASDSEVDLDNEGRPATPSTGQSDDLGEVHSETTAWEENAEGSGPFDPLDGDDSETLGDDETIARVGPGAADSPGEDTESSVVSEGEASAPDEHPLDQTSDNWLRDDETATDVEDLELQSDHETASPTLAGDHSSTSEDRDAADRPDEASDDDRDSAAMLDDFEVDEAQGGSEVSDVFEAISEAAVQAEGADAQLRGSPSPNLQGPTTDADDLEDEQGPSDVGAVLDDDDIERTSGQPGTEAIIESEDAASDDDDNIEQTSGQPGTEAIIESEDAASDDETPDDASDEAVEATLAPSNAVLDDGSDPSEAEADEASDAEPESDSDLVVTVDDPGDLAAHDSTVREDESSEPPEMDEASSESLVEVVGVDDSSEGETETGNPDDIERCDEDDATTSDSSAFREAEGAHDDDAEDDAMGIGSVVEVDDETALDEETGSQPSDGRDDADATDDILEGETLRDPSEGHISSQSSVVAEQPEADAVGESSAAGDSTPGVMVPRASRFGVLRDVLDQVAAGRRRPEGIARRLGGETSAVNRYLELAGWFRLLETRDRTMAGDIEVRQPVRTTELGRRFAGDPDASHAIARRQLEATPLMRGVRQRDEWPRKPGVAVSAVLLERTDLSVEDVRSGAKRIVYLLDQLALPEAPSPDHSFELPDARQLPVRLLDPPGLLGSVLEIHDVETIGDLMTLDSGDLEGLDGVGPKKAEALRELQNDARMHAGLADDATPDPLASEVADAWVEAGWDGRESLDTIELELPSRLETAFEASGVGRLDQVAGVIAHMDLTSLPGVGESTASTWREHLELLASEGRDAYRFGPGGRPDTISSLIARCRDQIEPRAWRILRRHLLAHDTQREIGEDEDLSRERIRQIFQSTLETFADRYAEVAAELTAPLREVLGGEELGLLHRERARRTVGADDPLHLVLALRIAGVGDAKVWQQHFVRTASQSDIEDASGALEEMFRDTHRLFLRIDDVLRFADETGFDLTASELEDLLRVQSDAEPDVRRRFRNPRATKGDRIAETLREARQALDLGEIAERFEATYANDDERTDRDAVQPYCADHPHLYAIDRGVYLHQDSLPLDKESLEAIESRCLQLLRGKRHGVSTHWLIEQLETDELGAGGRLEALNPTLLRDILVRHEEIGTSVNSYNVTWEPTYAYEDVTLADRLERMLKAAGTSMSTEMLLEGFPEGVYAHPGSISQVLDEVDWAMAIGDDYIHVQVMELDDEERAEVIEGLEAALPGPDEVAMGAEAGHAPAVVSLEVIAGRLRDRESLPPIVEEAERGDREWRDVLEAFVEEESAFVTEAGELIARRDTLEAQPIELGRGSNLLDRAIVEIVAETYPSYPREIAAEFRERLELNRPDETIKKHLHDLHDEGPLGRITPGIYFPEDVSDDILFDQLERLDRDLSEVTERSDLEELPASELWMLAQFLHETSRWLKAKQILEILADRDDPDEAWLERLETVTAKIQKML